MISKTNYVNAGPIDQDDAPELERLGELAATVLAHTESWIGQGLDHAAALALVQNALPLTEDPRALARLQRRSHAHVLAALLLLLEDPTAGHVATDLVEVLHDEGPQERVLAS